MTVEEAYVEMHRRGWGFARNDLSGTIAIGPIQNPNYELSGESPLIEVLAFGKDPVETLEAAIARADSIHPER